MKNLKLMNVWMLLLMPAFASAQQQAALSWTIVPAESRIGWQVTQNNAPLEGSFGRFAGEIRFHPDALASSYAKMVIDTASITTSYDEAKADLQKPEWFDVAQFPQAIFEASRFTLLSEGRYRAEGTLTIKGKSQPLALDFTLKQFSDNAAQIEGEATLSRSAFGIGWADTNTVADAVTVKVAIKASR